MSADTAECGCEGHADQQIPECRFPELRAILTRLVQRLEKEHGGQVLLSAFMLQELELAKKVLKGARIEMPYECTKCWKDWIGGIDRCDCGGKIREKEES